MRYAIVLTILISCCAYGEEQVYGEWKVDSFTHEEQMFSLAVTSNDSGSSLGVICMSASDVCAPYLVNGLSCEEDASYPALIAVDEGITYVELGCVHFADRHLFILPEEHLEYFISSNTYSVAYGTEGGKFKAGYFSLNGSAKAIIAAKTLMGKAAKNAENNKKASSYRDDFL